MNPHHGQASACPQGPTLSAILAGRAWKARALRNNCLRQHAHALARCFRRQDLRALKQTCIRLVTVLETRSRVFHEIHPTELALVPALTRLSTYEDRWLRAPEDWQPHPQDDAASQWADFLRHLLARYPVPRFMDAAWFVKGPLEHFERDCWCALGFGQSLRKVPGFPASVSNRVLHLTLGRERAASLPSAIWETQMDLLQATPILRREVLASGIIHELYRHGLWTRLLEKFVAGPEAAARQWTVVTQALTVADAEGRAGQVEGLLKLPLSQLIQHSVRWVTQLLKANGHLLTEKDVQRAVAKAELSRLTSSRWPPFLGNQPVQKNAKPGAVNPWQMEELCTVHDLQAEGKVMKHCVAGYAHRCKQGHSAIFSLRRYETDATGQTDLKSYATLEVRVSNRKIVQIKAWANRPVNGAVMSMIQQWASSNGVM